MGLDTIRFLFLIEGTMDRDPQVMFQEAWELAARRVNAGKHSKDRIKFFLKDGTTKTFDIPPMRDDSMKDDFLKTTLKAILNHPVEALMLSYEAWFLIDEEATDTTDFDLEEYVNKHILPRNHPKWREGVNFYYETVDGIILTSIAEILTINKKKRELAELSKIEAATKSVGRMNHFFQKAREYSMEYRHSVDDIIERN